MEASSSSGGPAPFLVKTYEMVDDSSTDEIVSWSPSNASFIVWNPLEFARLLLPTYFKHNNFSSFIRQLNTYGFHKIDPERWEFANEEFMKDRKHLLKNIHRRKPIHSHSQPPPDPERLAFEEEIEKLTREKNELDAKVSGFKMHRSSTLSQVEDITKRIGGMEQRQEKLLTILQKAVQNPGFVELLAQKIDAMELSAYNKKRRLPQVTSVHPAAEDNFVSNQSSCRSEFESIHPQDMSNKLNLELSTAVSNIHLVSNSTQSSSDDWASPPRKSSDGVPKDIEMGITILPFAPETVELLDTETCLALHSLVPREECEGHISCELDLSLACAKMLANQDLHSDKATHMEVEPSPDDNGNSGNFTSSQEVPSNSTVPPPTPAAPARVNDQFWEKFLTERPGSSDTEEACSSYRAPPFDDQEDRGSSHGLSRASKNMGKLSL